MNIDQIINLAQSPEIKLAIANTYYRLPQDYWHWLNLNKHMRGWFLGEDWWDHASILRAFSRLAKPEIYLEVGVRKSGSMSQVLAESPGTLCIGFDLWQQDYCVVDHWPAPPASESLAMQALEQFHPLRKPQFISGDSRETLNAFFNANPGFMADIALVDGDHSEEGAMFDLEVVFPHARVIVFDDVTHDAHPYLEKVFDSVVAKCGPGYSVFKNRVFVGAAIAVKS